MSQYRKPDGSLSSNKADAIRVAPDVVLELARQSSAVIPAEFVLNMALNETGSRGDEWPAANAVDDGGRSKGMLQVDDDEQRKSGVAGDIFDPATNVRIFSGYLAKDLAQLAKAARLDLSRPLPLDIFKYLAWGHNAGVGEPLASIQRYGLDWDKLKARPQNAYVRDKLIPYAERAVFGAGRYGKGIAGITPLVAALVDATSGTDEGDGGDFLVKAGVGVAIGGLLWAALS